MAAATSSVATSWTTIRYDQLAAMEERSRMPVCSGDQQVVGDCSGCLGRVKMEMWGDIGVMCIKKLWFFKVIYTRLLNAKCHEWFVQYSKWASPISRTNWTEHLNQEFLSKSWIFSSVVHLMLSCKLNAWNFFPVSCGNWTVSCKFPAIYKLAVKFVYEFKMSQW